MEHLKLKFSKFTPVDCTRALASKWVLTEHFHCTAFLLLIFTFFWIQAFFVSFSLKQLFSCGFFESVLGLRSFLRGKVSNFILVSLLSLKQVQSITKTYIFLWGVWRITQIVIFPLLVTPFVHYRNFKVSKVFALSCHFCFSKRLRFLFLQSEVIDLFDAKRVFVCFSSEGCHFSCKDWTTIWCFFFFFCQFCFICL